IGRQSNRLDTFARIKSVKIRPIGLIRDLFFLGCTIALLTPSVCGQQIVDQVLTQVNDDIITRIDLLWSIAIDPKAPSPVGPVGADLLRQKLDVMIDERLIAQEAARIPTSDITQDEIDKKRTALIAGFKSE